MPYQDRHVDQPTLLSPQPGAGEDPAQETGDRKLIWLVVAALVAAVAMAALLAVF